MENVNETFTPEVSKEQMEDYIRVQKEGLYNMLSPEARQLTDMSREEWMYIIKNYSAIRKYYKLY